LGGSHKTETAAASDRSLQIRSVGVVAAELVIGLQLTLTRWHRAGISISSTPVLDFQRFSL
jgi:hypothetical protein